MKSFFQEARFIIIVRHSGSLSRKIKIISLTVFILVSPHPSHIAPVRSYGGKKDTEQKVISIAVLHRSQVSTSFPRRV